MGKRKVTIEIVEVGQKFGCAAVIRDAKTDSEIVTTNTRPYGYDSSARADAMASVYSQGWIVVDKDY